MIASLKALPQRPTVRIYLDVQEPPTYYLAAISRLAAVSTVMGELLDSSDEARIGTHAFEVRARSYVRVLGRLVKIWEIGNEVNGNWTGPYPEVRKKLAAAYRAVVASDKTTALTLYYNVGCHDGPLELGPLEFSKRYVPKSIRDSLDYVFLSYYEDDCHGLRPTQPTWRRYFERLHQLYPRAKVGFGEIGLNNPATRGTLFQAASLMKSYYGLRITLPYYVGGYFWWYYAEDCVPFSSKPLWADLKSAFREEAVALATTTPR